jgi:16S rRNA (adenine1518-N6/adenine1519-N6)-dimethyltransferase
MRLAELKKLLDQYGLRPQQAFGQNFLVDPALLEAIPNDAGVVAGDRVLEVGPGVGSLTISLIEAGARVLAVEIDHGLCQLLRDRFHAEIAAGTLELVEADVLAAQEQFHPRVEQWWHEGHPPRLVANLPYSISGPFLARLPGRTLQFACLLLQREFAVKAAGKANSKDYGPLSVRLDLAFHPRLGRRLPANVFWPRPSIASAFLLLQPRLNGPTQSEHRRLAQVLRFAFGQRRKRLLGRLELEFPAAAAALRAAGVEENARPEQVSARLWLLAVQALE